jgi:ubiquinone/menaquinone biosynthesis C-methylase UbiE
VPVGHDNIFIILTQLAYNVWAADYSQSMLKIANNNLKEQSLTITFGGLYNE